MKITMRLKGAAVRCRDGFGREFQFTSTHKWEDPDCPGNGYLLQRRGNDVVFLSLYDDEVAAIERVTETDREVAL